MHVLFLFVARVHAQNAFRVFEQNEFSSSESPSRTSRPHWVVRLIKQLFSNSLTCPSSDPRSPFDKLNFLPPGSRNSHGSFVPSPLPLDRMARPEANPIL
ncbi:hypothetical protein ISCGN_026894 [Ixodes scapularis]